MSHTERVVYGPGADKSTPGVFVLFYRNAAW